MELSLICLVRTQPSFLVPQVYPSAPSRPLCHSHPPLQQLHTTIFPIITYSYFSPGISCGALLSDIYLLPTLFGVHAGFLLPFHTIIRLELRVSCDRPPIFIFSRQTLSSVFSPHIFHFSVFHSIYRWSYTSTTSYIHNLSNMNNTTTIANNTCWQPNGDTILAILFGTISLVFAGLQVIFSWQGVRALQARH